MKQLIILLLIAGGCGNAEAKPIKTINVKIVIVGDALSWTDLSTAWAIVVQRLQRDVTGSKVVYTMDFDREYALSGPPLNLTTFWDGSLLNYWRSVVPTDSKSVRLVVLPALYTPQGNMYGGWSWGVCHPKGGWALVNVEPGNTLRNALTIGHELGHQFGSPDWCEGSSFNGVKNINPSIMCWSDAPALKSDPLATYNWLPPYKMRACLGLKN